MSKAVRDGVDRIRAVNPSLGDWPMFPAPRARVEHERGKIPKAWTRHHARRLLERAEKKAELPAVEGSDFHCYRRKWATERKHLPVQDVARAGAWKDIQTLQQAYQQPDHELRVPPWSPSRRSSETRRPHDDRGRVSAGDRFFIPGAACDTVATIGRGNAGRDLVTRLLLARSSRAGS